jgi:hypothetical protein
MQEQELIMNPFRLKAARPELWPIFTAILKNDAPKYYDMFVNDPVITGFLTGFEARITVKVNDLPKRAQDLVYKAMKEAQERMKQNG